MQLSETEIKKRLIELHNLRALHVRARERIVFLEKENKQLRMRVKELEARDKDKGDKIEAMTFQLEQIKIKLFGKKPIVNVIIQKKEKKERGISSYRRPIPKNITETKSHSIENCTHCNQKLEKKSIRIFFEEDIPLPIQKIIIKHEVEIGYCNACKKQSGGFHIPSKKSVLGENVKKYVCILCQQAESAEFGKRKKKQILKTYQQFSDLYQSIRKRIGNEISPYLKNK